jgi:hypothetical protein
MIVVTPAMASRAPGGRLAMVLSREPLLGDLWWDGVSGYDGRQRGLFLGIFSAFGCQKTHQI